MSLRPINGERRNAAIRSGSVEIPFAQSVAFDGQKQMVQTAVRGALEFSINTTNAIDGASVSVDLLANGTNVPTFFGPWREWGGSMGYDNRSGIRNCLTMFRRARVYWYSWAQAAGATAEPVPAIAITLSGPSFGVVSVASSNFTIGANGVITGSIVVTPSDGGGGGTFTPSTVTISSGTPTATFTYTPASTGAKTISATNDGGLSNPADLPYTSTSQAQSLAVLRVTTLSNITESGDGTAGWNYAATNGWAASYGVSAAKIAAGQDGSVRCTIGHTVHSTASFCIGLKTNGASGNYLQCTYGQVVGTTYRYLLVNGGFVDNGAGQPSCVTGDIVRVTKTGTTIVADKSSDSGATWTTLKTWTNVAQVDYFLGIFGDKTGSINPTMSNIRHSGFA